MPTITDLDTAYCSYLCQNYGIDNASDKLIEARYEWLDKVFQIDQSKLNRDERSHVMECIFLCVMTIYRVDREDAALDVINRVENGDLKDQYLCKLVGFANADHNFSFAHKILSCIVSKKEKEKAREEINKASSARTVEILWEYRYRPM